MWDFLDRTDWDNKSSNDCRYRIIRDCGQTRIAHWDEVGLDQKVVQRLLWEVLPGVTDRGLWLCKRIEGA